MTNQKGRLLIISKHWLRQGKKHNKTRSRKFHEPEDIDLVRDLATGYANHKNEDFIIVEVVEEISRPNPPAPAEPKED